MNLPNTIDAAGIATPAPNVRPTIDTATNRLGYIDGLRALAAIAVVFDHAALTMPMWAPIPATSHVPWYWLGHILVDGAHGVDLFFVLSGFCLAYPTLLRLHSTGMPSFNITRFAVHRLVRILPPYYIATVVLLVAAFVAYLHTGRFNTPGGAPLHLNDIVGQLLLLDRNVQLASAPYWTLIVELRWYFIFPVALFVFVRSRNGFLALIGLAYIAYFFTRVHNLDLGLLPAFLLGILAADLIVTRHPICRFALPLMFASLGVAAIIEPVITMPDNYGIEQACFFYQTNPGWHFAAFFLVLAAANISLLRAALSPRWLTILGVASYSIYLMHYPIVIYVGTRLMRHNSPVGYIATVLAAIAVGVAFYFAAEQWFTRGPVRDRLCDWLTPYAKAIAHWIDSSRPALRAVPAVESDAKPD